VSRVAASPAAEFAISPQLEESKSNTSLASKRQTTASYLRLGDNSNAKEVAKGVAAYGERVEQIISEL
jgi:hypothetical protein